MVEGCIQQNAFDGFRQNKTFFIESLVFSFSRKWDILDTDSAEYSRNTVRGTNYQERRREHMRDDNCIFCKIARGELPAATIYEDDEFRVILDLGPASKGHALILPKEHYRNLFDLDDELAAKAMVLAKKMINKMKDVLGCDGYNIVQNNEEVAGQTVFHFHMHLIPRYKGDNVGLVWQVGELSEADREEILNKLK